MTRPEQRAREVQIVTKVLEALGLTPLAIEEGPNPPDVLVCLSDGKLAIEVTEFHSSQKRRQAEEAWTDMILASREVRKKYPEINSLSVHIDLKKPRLPKRSQIRLFVDEVIQLCQDYKDKVGKDELCLRKEISSYPLIASVTNYVILREVGIYMDWSSSLISGWVGLNEEELLKAVEKKAINSQKPDGTSEFWLVVVGGIYISQVVGFINEEELREFTQVNEALAASAFDAVYLCDAQIARWTPVEGWKMVREWEDHLTCLA